MSRSPPLHDQEVSNRSSPSIEDTTPTDPSWQPWKTVGTPSKRARVEEQGLHQVGTLLALGCFLQQCAPCAWRPWNGSTFRLVELSLCVYVQNQGLRQVGTLLALSCFLHQHAPCAWCPWNGSTDRTLRWGLGFLLLSGLSIPRTCQAIHRHTWLRSFFAGLVPVGSPSLT